MDQRPAYWEAPALAFQYSSVKPVRKWWTEMEASTSELQRCQVQAQLFKVYLHRVGWALAELWIYSFFPMLFLRGGSQSGEKRGLIWRWEWAMHGGVCVWSGSGLPKSVCGLAVVCHYLLCCWNFCSIPYTAVSSAGDLSCLQISCGSGKTQLIVVKPS